MPNAERIKVMLVDDHPIVRSGLVTMLLAFDDLELVGEASSGDKALVLCQQELPDVILMDMVMPGMDGLETTRKVLEEYPSVKIIILTSFTKDSMVQDALEAGATSYPLEGFIHRSIGGSYPSSIYRTTDFVARGHACFG